MKKVEVAIRYNDTTFKLVDEVRDLKVYIDTSEEDYCIITDKEGNVLIEVSGGKGMGCVYLNVVVNKE